MYEGGIRVPWIVKWPSQIKSGSTCDVPVTSIDLFPTILEIAGITDAKPLGRIDGESNVSLLRQTGKLKRDAIFWHYPHFCLQGVRPGGIIRQGDFKLIERYEGKTLELYNLKDDLSETTNLVIDMPQKALELRKRLHNWRKSVHANMCPPNPYYKHPRK